MLRTLDGYLDRMSAIADDAEQRLREVGPAAAADLARLRREQAQTMTSYQLFVHREMFEPLIAGDNAEDARRARLLKAECISLGEDFRQYVRDWATRDVAAEWAVHQPAALAMVQRARSHIASVRHHAAGFVVDRRPSGLVPPLAPRENMAEPV